ncbi:MAG: hypothetical protein LBG96_13380 [Tannerella sp.]|jgi:3-hydroxymyristoyl/3-hydroxydecanoyl-(acyl carrier protein) dehydratase|nr:hypothetical protein [Tannerella sp.]
MSVKPTDVDVIDLLPQRLPFIMVDKLIHFDSVSAKTIFTVREDHLFCTNGFMEEAGFVENIAQTCAARTGYKQRMENDRSGIPDVVYSGISGRKDKYDKIKIGVIGMISVLEMKRRPLAGEVLETSIFIEEEVFLTTFIRSEVKIGDEIVATCRMKLFLTDKTAE